MKNLTLLSKHAFTCNLFSTFKLFKLFGCNQLHILFVPLASIEYEWVKQNQFVESEDHEYFCLSFLLFVYFPTLVLNPYPPGEGGGGQIDPPPYEIRDCLATTADRDTPFHEFFLSSLSHLLTPSFRKSDHRSRGDMTFCTHMSAQYLPKIVCVQNTWK